MQPQTKEEWQPSEAWEGKEEILPQSLWKEHGPADTFIVAQWYWLQTFGLQKRKRNACHFKPQRLWQFITAALGN